ncbi:hypothetical protein [Mucilaginibacter aquariorum]|uniref:Uncharacterized protein n=1 Tax=Mucilaginibacter aquariorum TaxID=2967225 RepID=A0ABT1SVL6_9SPHI|nr:hypothetical protein [Mucilaginibacter aquariorum]MCQ6956385.1 hypothetical protein [Mucilaginibacter aquariorum]
MLIKTLILFSFISPRPVSDLSRFIASRSNVVYERTSDQLRADVRFNQGTSCPAIILLIYSPNGKLISTSAFNRSEFINLLNQHKIHAMNGHISCVMVSNIVYVYDDKKKPSDKHLYKRQIITAGYKLPSK